ncbi:methylthioribose kinase [Neokomagataea thailandica NBRC 106555]|uniref:S-methyl-5-thioribose kinase n=2 Tax=Neokomagataea TaxID=1223423 RepID=A0A4Y6V7D1_9PROT|nr:MULTISPECIES: S-methyl-5-thioribose kinase [Neokomagataea]QDH25294.1 S-methyl-5-thioribose kinase [Neokomagataea tanensis]GBR54238.1 methylthioribose kinase [Neokomagataea thailandica NBRC 106555]
MSYYALTPDTLRDYLAQDEALASRLGGTADTWHIREVSDGNLNLVFIVTGHLGAVCCKQALPHVRVAPTWPMPLERALFEARYMQRIAQAKTPHAVELYAFDNAMYLLVMEALLPHQVLRSQLIANKDIACFSAPIARYISHTAHASSWHTQRFETGSQILEEFSGNTALTRITVDLILSDPFRQSERNPTPEAELLPVIHAMQDDADLLRAVTHLQTRFLSARQALLHGDLHTGSIMLHDGDIRVIDGEFALMGPIGFDCGLYIANLILHACAAPSKADFIRNEIQIFWDTFTEEMQRLFDRPQGDAAQLLPEHEDKAFVSAFLQEIFQDTVGFCGLEIIRRTIGFAQIADYDLCETPEARLAARQAALSIGKALVLQHQHIASIAEILAIFSTD